MYRVRQNIFSGSGTLLLMLFLGVITIPFALIYLIESTVATEQEFGTYEEFKQAVADTTGRPPVR